MDQLIIACCRKKHIFCLTDVIRLEARSSYTVIYSLSKPPLTVAKVLSDYETLLVNLGFLRVHRSHLINRQFITDSCSKRSFVRVHHIKIEVPRRKRKEIFEALKKP